MSQTTTKPEPSRTELTYSTYLKLPELLEQQVVQSDPPEHDELLFIVIHQTYELLFKLLLHELDKIKRDFSAGDLYGAIATFQRARTIMKTLVGQLDIIETMTPMSFGSFRERLDTSSGFQSTQFREFEFLLGYKRPNVLKYHEPGGPGYERMMRRYHEPSLVDHFFQFLAQQGVPTPESVAGRSVIEPSAPCPEIHDQLLTLYRERHDLAILFELMTDFDEGLQEWRYRHVKIVERTIGSKQGTGGSLGVEFLKKSLFLAVWHDLWAIRHKL
jgi:tryptophan 2,3-dioxygenase